VEVRALDTPLTLPQLEAVTIDLAKDVEDFLEQQVRAGACANASELVVLLACDNARGQPVCDGRVLPQPPREWRPGVA
jgi:hypothetical protein